MNALGFVLCLGAIGLLLFRNRIITGETDLRTRQSRLEHYFLGRYWLDLGMGELYHPILGAGAGVARVGQPGDGDHPTDTATVGVGVFRAAFEVVLPVRDTDARAGIEALGSLPVAKPRDLTASGPWALFVATVGVGF